MADDKKTLRCSFCGKPESQVHRMIQGPGVRICDECVQLCMSILDDGYSAAAEDGVEDMNDLPTPRERIYPIIKGRRQRRKFKCYEPEKDYP